jgi:hypothetical protein
VRVAEFVRVAETFTRSGAPGCFSHAVVSQGAAAGERRS